MIKPNVVIVLLVLCVLLMAGFFLVQGERPKVKAPVNVNEKLVRDFNSDSVNKIEIKKGDVALKLEKKDKNWVLASSKGRPVQKDRVDTLLSDTKSAMREGTRSSKDDSSFDLDEKGRTEISLQSEAGNVVLYVGKDQGWGKTFVRTEAGGPIFDVDKGLDKDAGVRTEGEKRILDPAYFYDLKVLSITADDIIDIAIKKGNDVVRVQKVIPGKGPLQPKQEPGKDDPKPLWWLTEPEGAAADDSSVSSIASNLSALNAKSYADAVPEKDRGLDKPNAKVVLRLKDGSEHTFVFGKIEGDDVILSVAGKPDPYKVYKYVYESVTRDLKKKEEEKKTETAPKAEEKTSDASPPKADGKKAEEKKADEKAEEKKAKKAYVTPPPPPAKIEPEAKPAIPPAVAKQLDEKPKIEEKK
ncbi:MAG: DUF4340 domain-containing protein [Planctomycetota bacterium]|nr:DUF4340 domain-containing protein [Planctomycetota bacterium]